MDHVLVSFHSQAYPTLSTFLFSNTKNRRFRRKVTKAPTLVRASMVGARFEALFMGVLRAVSDLGCTFWYPTT